MKIVATKCVEGFPDDNVPCILVYKVKKLVSNSSRVDKYLSGGIESFEQFLTGLGVFYVDVNKKTEE